MSLHRLRWRDTLDLLRADHARLAALAGPQEIGTLWQALRRQPAMQCVALYRLSNHLWRAGRRWPARLVWHLNLLLTGADISEPADLGPGLVIPNPAGVAIMGTAGRNLTVLACAGLGGEIGRREDVGAGPGLSLLGDDVLLRPHSGVLGPVRVGHRVVVGVGIAVTSDVADDTLVEGPRARLVPRGVAG